MFKESFKLFKRVWLRSFFVDLSFVVFVSLFFFAAKLVLRRWIAEIMAILEANNITVGSLNYAAISSSGNLSALLGQLDPLVQKSTFLIFNLVPLVLMAIFSLEVWFFYTMALGQKYSVTNLLKIFLVNLPIFIGFFYVGNFLLDIMFGKYALSFANLIIVLAIMALLFCISNFTYIFLFMQKMFLKSFKKKLYLILKKSVVLYLIASLQLVLFLEVSVLMFSTYVYFDKVAMIPIILGIIISLIAMTYLRTYYIVRIKKNLF